MADPDKEASSSMSLTREDLELLCFRNLLATPGERLFFKDLQSRFLLVSESLAGEQSHGFGVEELKMCIRDSLDPPLLGLLDEAPSIAPVPSLPELLADGRGRGIVLVYAMQSFSQAVTRWGAQRAQTMGNATSITAVLGGLTSPTDLADLERICGQRRVRRVSTHRGTGGRNGRDHSRTISWESEAVLRADQIRTLQAGICLLYTSRCV